MLLIATDSSPLFSETVMELNSGAVDPATDSTASHDLQMNRAVAFLLEESEEDMEGEVHIELTNTPCQKKLYFPYVGFRG